jgi:hypothetical protein
MKSSIRDNTRKLRLPGFKPIMLAAALSLLAMGASNSAVAGANPNPGIAPPGSHPYGKSYSEWAAAWWQWALSFPTAVNPLLDTTGQFAGLGQSGPVFFLAGDFGGSVERTCTVPAGKALLFPLLNEFYLGFPCDARNLPGCEVDQALEQANDIATLLSFISAPLNGAALSCEIDEHALKDLQRYREQSSAIFSVTLPEDNVFSSFGIPAGPYHPCVDTGYYLMVAPLTPGSHKIHFTSQAGDGSASLEVMYHLTVAAGGDRDSAEEDN